MQSSVSIGLKVKTHKPAAESHKHSHTHTLSWLTLFHMNTLIHTHNACRCAHTLMLGRLTASDQRRADWLRQLMGSDYLVEKKDTEQPHVSELKLYTHTDILS